MPSLSTKTASLQKVDWMSLLKLTAFIGGAYVIYRAAKGIASLFPKDASEEGIEKFIEKKKQEGQQASYSDVSYTAMADAIYQAGEGVLSTGLGTDDAVIYGVFEKMKNDLDVAKLFEAFGERRIEYKWDKGNLGVFLRNEFNEEEMNKLNSMLAEKHIETQF